MRTSNCCGSQENEYGICEECYEPCTFIEENDMHDTDQLIDEQLLQLATKLAKINLEYIQKTINREQLENLFATEIMQTRENVKSLVTTGALK